MKTGQSITSARAPPDGRMPMHGDGRQKVFAALY